MKIQKKHAVAIADMFVFMAFESYYPLSPGEEDLIGRVLSFAVYHDLAAQDELEGTKGYGDIKIKKTARLDLTAEDVPVILEVYEEVQGDPNLVEDALLFGDADIKYLKKTFPEPE
ncbi:MAG: hypothetical protein ACYSW8_11085 [Planctomycetota bacterium]|jgi:hypothetical protein